MTFCRHCGGRITRPSWSSDPNYWVHLNSQGGLYGSDECWPTPKAEPELA